ELTEANKRWRERKRKLGKSKGLFTQRAKPTPSPLRMLFKSPTSFAWKSKAVKLTLILNRDKGWVNGQEMKPEQIAQQKEGTYAGWVTSRFPLKDKAFTITQLPDEVIDG